MTNKTVTGIVTWLKNWFYDKDEVDNLILSGGSGIAHTHANWSSVTCSAGSLSVNTDLRLAQWQGNSSASITTANSLKNLGSFNSTYAPPNRILQKANNTADVYISIGSDGKVGIISSSTGSKGYIGTILWKY